MSGIVQIRNLPHKCRSILWGCCNSSAGVKHCTRTARWEKDTRHVLIKNMTHWHECSAEPRVLHCDCFLSCDAQNVSCKTHPWTSLRFIRRVFSLLSLLFQAHVKIHVHDHGCFFRDISNLQRTRYLCLVMEDSYTLKNWYSCRCKESVDHASVSNNYFQCLLVSTQTKSIWAGFSNECQTIIVKDISTVQPCQVKMATFDPALKVNFLFLMSSVPNTSPWPWRS